MASVGRRNTGAEMAVRRAAHALGLRYRLNVAGLPGRPDLVFPRWNRVVFVHGCFWHRHPGCPKASIPKSNRDYWEEKFFRNVRRDRRCARRLRALGWRVSTIWECETKDAERLERRLRRIFPE